MAVLLDSERCILYLYDSVRKCLQTKAVRGHRIDCFSVQPNQGVVGSVFSTGIGVILKSPYDDLRFDRQIDQYRKSITRNMICVPLKISSDCIGCIEVANRRGYDYSQDDYQLVECVAREVSTGTLAIKIAQTKEPHNRIDNEFKENISHLTNENLLSPLLKNVLIILADYFKSEK